MTVLQDRLNHFQEPKRAVSDNLSTTVIKGINENFGMGGTNVGIKAALDDTLKEPYISTLQDLIKRLVRNLDGITLVLDEANSAFSIDQNTSDTDKRAMEDLLALFTVLTKEQRKVRTIILIIAILMY